MAAWILAAALTMSAMPGQSIIVGAEETETQTETVTGAGTETITEAASGTETELVTETVSETATEPVTETEPEAITEPATETGSEPVTEPESPTETETVTEGEISGEGETETEPVTEPETETQKTPQAQEQSIPPAQNQLLMEPLNGINEEAVQNVQAQIDALPTAVEVGAMSREEQQNAYMQAQNVWDAYAALTEEQQTQVDAAKLTELLDYFNGQTAVLEATDNQTENSVASVEIKGSIKYYDTIDEAFSAANGNTATIKLLRNVSSANAIEITGGNITFYGGNYSLELPNVCPISINGGSFTVESGNITSNMVTQISVSNGEFILNTGYVECLSINFGQSGTVTINGGTVNLFNGFGGGTLYFNGGSITRLNSGNVNIIYPAPTITTESLPEATVNQSYEAQLTATSNHSVTWSLADGSSLPDGLALSNAGVISGKPTAVNTAGVEFTVTATVGSGSGAGSSTKELTIKVNPQTITGTVTISGNAVCGQTLTATYSDGNTEAVRYQWYRGTTPIDGATNNTYILQTADIGNKISVAVIPTDTAFTGSVTSAETAEIPKLASDISFDENIKTIYTYGETITISGTVSGTAVMDGISVNDLSQDQVGLYTAGGTALATASVINGSFTLTYDTAGKAITPGESSQTLTVQYGGSNTMDAGSENINITLKPKSVTAVAGAVTKQYDGSNNASIPLSIGSSDLVNSDDQITLTGTGTYADVNAGENISITVTNIRKDGTDAAFYDVTAPAGITGSITQAPITGSVTITGNLIFGEQLTANYSNGNAGGNVTYQWNRNNEQIAGATGSTYTTTADDIGKTISVTVAGTGNYSNGVTSQEYGPIQQAVQSPPGEKEGYTIDYTNETISVANTTDTSYELTYNTEGEAVTGDKLELTPGETVTVYIRKAETTTHFPSAWTEITIPARPTFSLEVLDATASSLTVKADGAPAGAAVSYKIVAPGETEGEKDWVNADTSGTYTFEDLHSSITYTVYAKCGATEGSFSSDPCSDTFSTSGVQYLISIPAETTLTAGDPNSTATISIDGNENFDLGYGGAVRVTAPADVTLTRQNDPDMTSVLSALLVDGKTHEDAAQPIAVFDSADDVGVTISFAQPRLSNGGTIPAGNYEGTMTFTVSYKEE